MPRSTRQRCYAKIVRVTDGEQCKLMGLEFNKPMRLNVPRSASKAKNTAKSRAAGK